jgi:hypothetical protein
MLRLLCNKARKESILPDDHFSMVKCDYMMDKNDYMDIVDISGMLRCDK